MTTSESAASETRGSDLTPELLYKFLVSMKSSIQTARTSIIRRHARLIVKLKAMIKKATDKDDQKSLSASALKNKRKAIKLKNEVKTLKNLTENDIGKLVLLNTKNFNTATKEGASAGASAICRMAEHKALVEQRLRFTSHFGQSVSQLPFCVKVLGAEKRSRRLRKMKADKKGRMLEYERRLCKLLTEIGGEEFAAAERLYVKVLSMKKSLEKRKKTEKAWAKAQGPLGDRKAAYEEYLKTVQEGEEKETFASYVQKMDAIEGNTESASESDDDNDASTEDQNASEDEGADPKQLELRKKIFENLDAKFGEWNDDDSDMSDIDDVEVTPKQIEPRSGNNKSASSRGQSAELRSQKKEMSSKASPTSNKIKATKKRKRDADNSDTEGACEASNDRLKLNRSLEDHEAGSDRKPRHVGSEATSEIRDAQGPADTARVDDKLRPSLFTLFKKTALATKTPAPRALEKPKRPEPLDKNAKKSLYCDEEKLSPSTTSTSSAATSFFQGSKEKSVTALNKLFVGSKKKIVSENEDELAEIPESIAYEKVQKITRAGLAAECDASDDEQEDLAGFNSDFLLKHEGQSLLQHMSLRGGKRSRGMRGTETRGGGRGYNRGGFGRKSEDDFRGKSGDDFWGRNGDDFTEKTGDDDAERYPGEGGGDEGFGGRKFGVASSSHRRGEGGRRGGGSKRASAHRPANARFEDDESLHPSWAAKRLNSGAIAEFKGKRTVFD